MKVYLQNVQTGAFFQTHGRWTPKREDALNFQSVLDALDWSQNLQRMQLDIVLGFDDGQKDIRLSLGCVASNLPKPTPSLFSFAEP